MQQQPHALIRVDASTKTGRGHLSRCIGLADALERRCIKPHFLIPESDIDVTQWLGPKRWPVHHFSEVHGDGWPAQLLRFATAFRARYIVVDTYAAKSVHFKWLKEHSDLITVQFDDFAQTPYYSTLVISTQSSVRAIKKYGTIVLQGPSFIPLPSHLLRTKHQHRRFNRLKPFVLVTLGCSQVSARFMPIFRALQKLPDSLRIHIATTSWLAGDLRRKLPAAAHRWTLDINSSMVDLYRQAQIAISGGGMTALELAHWGVPLLCVPIAANQSGNIAELVDAGCGDLLSYEEIRQPQRLRNRLLKTLADTGRLRRMSQAGQQLVDGRGAKRIADMMIRIGKSAASPTLREFAWSN